MNLDLERISKIEVGKLLKRKEVLISFVILIVVFYAGRGVYKRQSALANSLKQRLTEQREVNFLALELDRLEADLLKSQGDIPAGKISTVNIVDRINQLAKKRNINISSISPRGQIDKGFYWEYPLEIEMVADYSQCLGLLRDVESPKNSLRINSLFVSLASQISEKGPKLSKVRISISAIALKK